MVCRVLLVLIELFTVLQVQSRTFEMCELARELKNYGLPVHDLPNWICLIDGESAFRTHVIGTQNWDGSSDHGLFQINDRYWCNNWDEPGKGCNVRCSDLRSDHIGAAVRCAKEVFRIHGFDAWVAWKNQCNGRQLPNISHCGVY